MKYSNADLLVWHIRISMVSCINRTREGKKKHMERYTFKKCFLSSTMSFLYIFLHTVVTNMWTSTNGGLSAILVPRVELLIDFFLHCKKCECSLRFQNTTILARNRSEVICLVAEVHWLDGYDTVFIYPPHLELSMKELQHIWQRWNIKWMIFCTLICFLYRISCSKLAKLELILLHVLVVEARNMLERMTCCLILQC